MDLLILRVGSWRSITRAATGGWTPTGTVKVGPKRLLKRSATSRVSSRCWRWSSPTGTSSRLVEQDVGRHQDGVGQKSDAVALLSLRLLLEGNHARELAVGSHALEEPVQLGVIGHVALDEDRADLGVEARGEVAWRAGRSCSRAAPRARSATSGRAGPRRSRRRRRSGPHPLAQRPEVVTEVQRPLRVACPRVSSSSNRRGGAATGHAGRVVG